MNPYELADEEALRRRVGATRCGHHVVEQGQIVQHFDTEKKYEVLEVHDFWGDAWDVGGNELEVVEVDDDGPDDADPPCTTEHVHLANDQPEGAGSPNRASFCEFCFMHFESDFVTWPWDNGAPKRYFEVARSGKLYKPHSQCGRCAVYYPRGRVLWRWLALQTKLSCIGIYWFKAVHTPTYMGRMLEEVGADTGLVLA